MSSSSINATCSSSVPVSLMNTSQISKSQADILDPTQDDQKPLSSDNIALPPNPDTTD
ncbi:outer dense fiber of sperm tails 4 [Rattus norvegicus]|nr:outer dense fiber of sperm tails 4 [Rattus norvegicus]